MMSVENLFKMKTLEKHTGLSVAEITCFKSEFLLYWKHECFIQRKFCFADGLFNQYISQQEYKPRWGQIIPKSTKGKDIS